MIRSIVGLALVLVLASCHEGGENGFPTPEVKHLQTNAQLIEVDPERALIAAYKDGNRTFLVGGGTGGESGVIYRYEQDEITLEETPAGPALWWVWGNNNGEFWACGDGGRILRRQRNGDWITEQTPIDAQTILFGIWGDSNNRLYAVGGSYRVSGEQNILLTSQGDGNWTKLPLPEPPEPFTFFKIWGEDPMYVVGDVGWILMIQDDQAQYVQTSEGEVLFTVHGFEQNVFAVGGASQGEIYGLQSGNVVRQQLPNMPTLNGLYVREDGLRLAAGEGGLVMIGTQTGAWTPTKLFPQALAHRTIHAVVSPDTSIFVGGDLRRMRQGFIVVSPDFKMNEGTEQ